MRPVKAHVPGRPPDDDPPVELTELVERYRPRPPVIRWGLTATTDGRWALLVTVPADVEVPLPDVESMAGEIPVVYEAEPDEPMRPLAE